MYGSPLLRNCSLCIFAANSYAFTIEFISSSSVMYVFTRTNKSSIVTLSFDFSELSGFAQNNERYAVYLCGGSNSDWVSLENNNNVCTLTLTEEQVANFTTIIFCRMNGNSLENNWDNRWNQTEDLMIEGNAGKTYKITSWGTGNKVNGYWN